MYKVLTNGTIYTGDQKISGKSIVIKDETIDSLIRNDSIPAEADVTDCNGCIIAPGFIDLQIAGAGGYLFSSNLNGQALNAISDSILKSGTTGFLIVLPTNSPEVYRKAIMTVRENRNPSVLGLHLEGPFINPSRRGAHAAEYIRKPDSKAVEELLKDNGDVVKMVTIAPELCTGEIIRQISGYGIVVCAGHSNATFDESMNGFSWGIKAVTHLFNAMSPLHHRDTGLPGAVIQSENTLASIVADGIHVDYGMVSIAKKLMKERLYLVSDAVEESNEAAVHHVRQADRFTLPDGTLSGSALTMMRAVKNCVEKIDIPIDEALRMASSYPAHLMSLGKNGKIKPGFFADLVVFDNSFEVVRIISKGSVLNAGQYNSQAAAR
jgi:N-acetylglucosamine-6-phosphate deacetylase